MLGQNARVKYESQRYVPYEVMDGLGNRFSGYSWEECFAKVQKCKAIITE